MSDPDREEPNEPLSPEVLSKWQLIHRGLHSWIDTNLIVQKLKEQEETGRPFKIYWGTATTGKPHLGYFVPIYKIADFLRAGCEVTILFADLHGYLDNMKSSWELLEYRCQYYRLIITRMLEVIGVDLTKLKFVRGSSYQLSEEYTLDMYRMSACVTTEHAIKAGAEVVKQNKNPLMSSLLYPMLQVLDEQYLDCDCQFGGKDQRKIFMYSRDKMPLIGYRKRAYLMNDLIPGLTESGKMSSSEPNSKIDFDDTNASIKKKIKKAFSVDGQIEGNGLLAILRHIIFPRIKQRDGVDTSLVVPRPDKFGGPQVFDNIDEVEKAFSLGGESVPPEQAQQALFSGDLKKVMIQELQDLVGQVRTVIDENQELLKMAYPE